MLSRCSQPTSDYSFVNLWGWAEEYGLLWAWDGNLVWIQQTLPESRYWAPIGNWENIDWAGVLTGHFKGSEIFTRVPEKLAELWKKSLGEKIGVEPVRGHWDYVYIARDLIELRGNRYHKKKNLLRQFTANYDFTYVPMDAALTEKAIELQANWCIWKDCEASDILSAENRVIEKVLENWNLLNGLTGGALLVHGDLVAYTIAEILDSKNLIIHFEKGDPDYKGVYQAINQMFLEHFGNLDVSVNREQDLDDEGLRKAKLSYHPVDFQRKFLCTLAGYS